MIQRKQSIYLFVAGLLSGISALTAGLWKADNVWVKPTGESLVLLFFLLSALISIGTVFLFKNRKLQMKLNGLNIVLNILLIAYLAYGLSNLPGGFGDSEKGIGLFVPFIAIGLLFIANRYISKDEKLVKSVDRFR